MVASIKLFLKIGKTATAYQEKINKKLRRQADRPIRIKKTDWPIAIKTFTIIAFISIIAAEYFDSKKIIAPPPF